MQGSEALTVQQRTLIDVQNKSTNYIFNVIHYTGQQNLTFFLAHEEKYLILIELLTLNSNV